MLCPVCLDVASNTRTPCGHEFCRACIFSVILRAQSVSAIPDCPVCRAPISFESLAVGPVIRSPPPVTGDPSLGPPPIAPSPEGATAMAETMRLPFDSITIRADADAVLGEGRSGRIVKAIWNGCPVAIKMLSHHLLGSSPSTRAAAVRALKAELGYLSNLRHPGIVEVFGWTESRDGSSFGLVMDQADGDLFQKLQELRLTREVTGSKVGLSLKLVPSGLSVVEFMSLARGIAGALSVMHAAGITHRDIKSPNILVKAGVFMICDLGVARAQATIATALGSSAAAATTAAAGFFGTAAWAAPEALDSDLPDGAAPPSDVYSYGTVLWEAYGGDQPWAGLSDLKIITKVLVRFERPPLRDTTPPALRALLVDCWDREPARRPTAQDLLRRLDAVAAELGAGDAASASAAPPAQKAVSHAPAAASPPLAPPAPKVVSRAPAAAAPSTGLPPLIAEKSVAGPSPQRTAATAQSTVWPAAPGVARGPGAPYAAAAASGSVSSAGAGSAPGLRAPWSGSGAGASTSSHDTRAGKAPDHSVPPSPNVFLGGLDEYVTPRDIVKSFAVFGRIVTVSSRNVSRGFAHILFASLRAATAAVEARLVAVAHTRARVSYAKGRSGSGAGGSGAGSGGGGKTVPVLRGGASDSTGVRSASLSAQVPISASARRGGGPAPRPLELAPSHSCPCAIASCSISARSQLVGNTLPLVSL